MMKLDFDKAENREKALADFKSLLVHPGWLLVQSIALENMDFIKNQIIEGVGEGETVETIARLRDRLKAYEHVIETPKNMIEKLGPAESVEEFNDDPYDK